MEIKILAADWSSFLIQLEFLRSPTAEEQQYVKQVFESWYSLGLLGGFNANFTPLQDAEMEDLDEVDYPTQMDPLPSLMHNMGEVEFEETWGRCWFDLGTADALAVDVLLNSLQTLSREYVPLRQVVLGGTGPEGDEL
ncbi:DUF3531 family protein [Candidatus Cyanaurora vandensis]|uniref:DUF3531 family protein n=1 Tax=Candidatus Cyanaurora vandensis TaxID=2714958 RepID=UPI0025801645|nr:DUF3531 family protein [Candidatus Cyanaurora vandensis]